MFYRFILEKKKSGGSALFGNHFISKCNIIIVNQRAYWLWFCLFDWFAWNITQAIMIMPYPCHCHKYTLRSRSTRQTVCIPFTASDILFTPFLNCVLVCHVIERSEGFACMQRFFAVSVSQLPSQGPMSITHSVCFP